ncbi:Uma2 family endonuclease [Chondromyces apiculatus]|uniref:Putative restriction endonuclease domain-containing protein n=1 Tax=Chondromyces apiculatus DSM 436 TaxID=1192034 RepID=A0A017TAG6_9BACT|nr:Uma2 family endonuclease [Chondromyces apiculatus]EYF05825.1 Hypothetical protein CAP_2826 [Chondromyces apiculatus DSM 436]
MSAQGAVKKAWTPEEYLTLERSSSEKHEYYQGDIFAMAGGHLEHNLLVVNLVGALWVALGEGSCRGLPSDMRLKVPATSLYT